MTVCDCLNLTISNITVVETDPDLAVWTATITGSFDQICDWTIIGMEIQYVIGNEAGINGFYNVQPIFELPICNTNCRSSTCIYTATITYNLQLTKFASARTVMTLANKCGKLQVCETEWIDFNPFIPPTMVSVNAIKNKASAAVKSAVSKSAALKASAAPGAALKASAAPGAALKASVAPGAALKASAPLRVKNIS